MQKMTNAVGIDFGTTKTMVSYFNPATGRVELVRLGRDRDSIPTTVHVDEAGAWTFGEDADDQIELDPEGYCRAFKLHLGERDPVLPRAGETAEALATRFLRHVREECERNVFRGESVSAATITIPVSFSPARKTSLKRAAEAAGFTSVAFLPEPEAAGTAFLRDNPADEFSRALVLDWGGGTLDIAVICRDSNGAILADSHCAEGRDDVGGEEIDRLLLVAGDERWREAFGTSLLEAEENEPKLLREAEKVKIGLSRKDVVTFRRGPRKIEVTRNQFNLLVGDLLDKAADLVKSALAKNIAQDKPAPDAILLIGGTSQTPIVREAMEKEFSGIHVFSWHHSHEAVALGATGLPTQQELVVPPTEKDASGNADSEQSHQTPGFEVAIVPKIGELEKGNLPEGFEEAPKSLGIRFAALGKPLSTNSVAYWGFGSESKALPMENGLLVYRKHLHRFAIVPYVRDGGSAVDLLSNPEEVDVSDSCINNDSEFRERELDCDERMEQMREEMHQLLVAIDWYQGNDAKRYEEHKRELQRELAGLESERKEIGDQLAASKASAKTGIFASVGSWWKESGLEVDLDRKKTQIQAKLKEIKENDEEASRHASWPIADNLIALEKAEDEYHAIFSEYCIARHFRERIWEEVLQGRNAMAELDEEINSLRESAENTAAQIAEMEKRLPALRAEFTATKSKLTAQEKKRQESEAVFTEREKLLKDSCEALMKIIVSDASHADDDTSLNIGPFCVKRA